jgi:hypothetical protein
VSRLKIGHATSFTIKIGRYRLLTFCGWAVGV